MTWNEEDHPRDEIGRFTYAGGSKENFDQNESNYSFGELFKLRAEFDAMKGESEAETLYKDSKLEAEYKKIESKYRDILLETLGKLATPANVLYADIKKLEQKVKENKLSEKLKQKVKTSPLLQKFTEKMIGKNYNWAKHTLSGLSGADVQGTLDLAHGEENMHNPEYIKDTVKLENYDDPAIDKYKKIVQQKVLEQFKDYGYNESTIKNIKGYYFKDDSEPSKRMAQSNDFKNIIKSNKQNILSHKKFSISFPKHGPVGILSDNNFKNTLGKADVIDFYTDKQGNMHLKIFDTYEFNKDAKDFLNKAGRNQMLEGNLKPYFTIFEVVIPKEVIDEILSD